MGAHVNERVIRRKITPKDKNKNNVQHALGRGGGCTSCPVLPLHSFRMFPFPNWRHFLTAHKKRRVVRLTQQNGVGRRQVYSTPIFMLFGQIPVAAKKKRWRKQLRHKTLDAMFKKVDITKEKCQAYCRSGHFFRPPKHHRFARKSRKLLLERSLLGWSWKCQSCPG